MKMKIFAVLAALSLAGAGCVSTVDGQRTAAVPFVKDTAVGYYERPVDQVFEAAKEVVRFNGTLVDEGTRYTGTNAVKTIEGKVSGRNIWIRISPNAKPGVSTLEVQARTSAGGTDLALSYELDKQIALKLVR